MQPAFFRPRVSVYALVLSVFLLPLGACQERELPTGAGGTRSLRTQRLEADATIRADEMVFAELARQSPSSAGFYMDSAGLVVVVRDSTDDAAARTAVGGLVAVGRIKDDRSRTGTIRVVRGRYSFDQLRIWRDLVFKTVVGKHSGVTSLDLTEHLNRVSIGIAPERMADLRSRIPAELATAGVDTAAIIYLSERPLEESAGGRPSRFRLFVESPALFSSSIVAQWDTLVGGIYVTGGGGGCTLGIVANWSGFFNVLVTASHCSQETYALDNSVLYQLSSPRQVGTEYRDPDGWTCNGQYFLWQCRWSDANSYTISSGIPNHRGLIARPQFAGGPGATGSTGVDTSRPYFIVKAVEGYPLATGNYVQKVGITTGWTWGQVTNTCKDFYPETMKAVLCAYESNASTDHGDSGGPVFVMFGNGFNQGSDLVTLVGITKGRNSHSPGHPDHRAVFSAWSSVAGELSWGGTLDADRPSVLSRPSISGSIQSWSPYLSWAPIAGATRYNVFYAEYNGVEQFAGTTTSPNFTQGLNVLEYLGASPVAPYNNLIQYYVYAVSNTDVSSKSNAVWFRFTVPFSVTISGPSVVGPNTNNCSSWVAQVAGAAHPISHQWSGLFSGTEAGVQGTVPETGGYLEVQVVDAQGRSGGYGLNITYDPNNNDSCQ